MTLARFVLARFLMATGLAIALPAAPGFAQQPAPHGAPCAPRFHVVEQLRETFGEHMSGSGLAETGLLFELYTGPSGSWTLLATAPGGVSCLIGAGEAWEPLPRPESFAGR